MKLKANGLKLGSILLGLIVIGCAISQYETERHQLLNRINFNPNTEMSLDERLIAFSSTEDLYNRNLVERDLCIKGGGLPDIDALDAHVECTGYAPADKGKACETSADCLGICIPTSKTCSSSWTEIKNCADYLSADGLTSSVCFGADGIGVSRE